MKQKKNQHFYTTIAYRALGLVMYLTFLSLIYKITAWIIK